MNNKKILYVLDTISIGGAELSVLELIKNIQEFDIIVCVIYKAKNELLIEFNHYAKNLILFNIPHRFGFFSASIKLKRVIQQERPILVHANHFRSEIIARIVVPSFKIPLVCTLISDSHSKDRYNLLSKKEVIKLEFYRFINKVTANRANLFLSVSNAIVIPNMKYLGIPKGKIKVIPNGRDVCKYNNAVPIERTSLNLSSEDILIVSNSRVIRSKGFDEIFMAFNVLLQNFRNIKLIIVGDGFDMSYYKSICNKLKIEESVTFLGRRKDIPEILKACDIFWFASHYEGSPGVVIEGMLSKIPIIASDINPNIENLVHKNNSLLFKMGDYLDLASQTRFLLENWSLKSKLTSNAYDLAKQKFDIRTIARNHEIEYKALIESYLNLKTF
ncbi:glycosyltransferase family 4 protein [Pleomorphovibrio marinus]|uniref:glycosyltransferase family 4 protein n=1 Tax=Pleomorphovibrio marinus TaxID=2164132 RepID=UPI000E0AC615|nr:glycosyltransferase family 4 protein [Pleomorphovibrio marinus]